jgi:hypothetical protein
MRLTILHIFVSGSILPVPVLGLPDLILDFESARVEIRV